MKCAFLLNARRDTLDEGFYADSKAGGYLYPPAGSTRAVVAKLRAHSRRFVVADNGAFDDIGRIAHTATSIAGPDRWEKVRNELRVAAAATDTQSELHTQLAIKPDAIVGAEDITLAVWLRAGLPEARLRRDRRTIAGLNRATARRGVALARSLPGVPVLVVASAHDFDTALDAGKEFADAKISAAAIGFGAFMADTQWTSTIKMRGRVHRLPRSLPARYLRTALVARGFFEGWLSSGHQPSHFHFLGLGAPIMLPIAALSARQVPFITFDATSPIMDAVSGSLYVNRPASLTVRTWKVAEGIAAGERRWTCPCKSCRRFMTQHPFDQGAASVIRQRSRAPFGSSDLRAGTPLAKAMPMFRIATDRLGKQAEQTRIAHNHWVLGNLARNLTTNARTLPQYVGDRVIRYEQNAGAAHYAEAVRLAFEVVRPGSTW